MRLIAGFDLPAGCFPGLSLASMSCSTLELAEAVAEIEPDGEVAAANLHEIRQPVAIDGATNIIQ
jgi:hypothetical protein